MLVIPPATARLLMPPPKYKNIIDKIQLLIDDTLPILFDTSILCKPFRKEEYTLKTILQQKTRVDAINTKDTVSFGILMGLTKKSIIRPLHKNTTTNNIKHKNTYTTNSVLKICTILIRILS